MKGEVMTRVEALGRGIAAAGRVARDEEGFTVYAAGAMPDAFRVWEDPHAGVTRCSCERSARAYASGEMAECEHTLAVALWMDPPDDAGAPASDAPSQEPLRRVV